MIGKISWAIINIVLSNLEKSTGDPNPNNRIEELEFKKYLKVKALGIAAVCKRPGLDNTQHLLGFGKGIQIRGFSNSMQMREDKKDLHSLPKQSHGDSFLTK